MYFPDLTPYPYYLPCSQDPSKRILSIGWLDRSHPYPTGLVSEEVFNAIFRACILWESEPTKGFYDCYFCGVHYYRMVPVIEQRLGCTIRLGNAEICIPGKGNVVYAAPNMTYHYMVRHGYRPPEEFIEAVMACDDQSAVLPKYRWI